MSVFDQLKGLNETSEDALTERITRLDGLVTAPMLATALGCEWNRERTAVKCPAHSEKTPSTKVYDSYFHCYGCGGHWMLIQFAALVRNISFYEALVWIEENFANFPKETEHYVASTSAEYRGPVNPELVEMWHKAFTPERRNILHRRLITDDTINKLRLGWRTESEAISIPFWRGVPASSLVDIVQFRSTKAEDKRYFGLTGHNRPSIINSHVIGTGAVLLLFGTFDAILCAQDGMAAISTNGSSTFIRNADNLDRLKSQLKGCRIYIIPDKTETETRSAYVLAEQLNAKVRHFPDSMPGKDYNQLRMNGVKPIHILSGVIMPENNGLILDPEHDQMVLDVLKCMSDGDWKTAETILLCLEALYRAPMINHQLQTRMLFDPYAGLNHLQWEQLRETIIDRLTYRQIAEWVYDACQLGHHNKGGF